MEQSCSGDIHVGFEPFEFNFTRTPSIPPPAQSETGIESISSFSNLLQSSSTQDGLASFGPVFIRLSDFSTPETELELNSNKLLKESAELMRIARVKCLPLIQLIYSLSGYSFIYKDCRAGKRNKFSQSLRYLCSQRTDQDSTKRKSTANSLALLAERSLKSTSESDAPPIALENAGGKGQAWRKGLGKGKKVEKKEKKLNVKTRASTKGMDRFDCRGTMVISIGLDLDTTQVTILHNIHHPIYVDVVGNRNRGNGGNTGVVEKEDKRADIAETGLEARDQLETVDILNRTEGMLEALLNSIRLLKERAEKGVVMEGEVELSKEVFNKTQELKDLLTRIDNSRREGKRRSIEEVEETENGGMEKEEVTFSRIRPPNPFD